MSIPSPINLNLNSNARDVNCLNRLFCCVSAQGNGNIQINTNDQVSNNGKDEKGEQPIPKKTNQKEIISKSTPMNDFEEEVILQQEDNELPPLEESEEEELTILKNINKNLVFRKNEFRMENQKERKMSQKFDLIRTKWLAGEDLSRSEEVFFVTGKKARQETTEAFFNGMAQYGHIQREIIFSMSKVDPLSAYKEFKAITVKDQQEIKKAYLYCSRNQKILNTVIERIQLATKFLELNPEFALYAVPLKNENPQKSEGSDLEQGMKQLSLKSKKSRKTKTTLKKKEPPTIQLSDLDLNTSKVNSPSGLGNENSSSVDKIQLLFLRVAHQVGFFDPVDVRRLGVKMRQLDVATLQEAYQLDMKYQYERIDETCIRGILSIVLACDKAYRMLLQKSETKKSVLMNEVFEEVLNACEREANIEGEYKESVSGDLLQSKLN